MKDVFDLNALPLGRSFNGDPNNMTRLSFLSCCGQWSEVVGLDTAA